MSASCHDCQRPYGDEHGFPDLIIPYDCWKRISPTGDDGGLLCPSCICKRLHDAGITCEGAFMSGPIISVSRPVMYALRRVENIELAIKGRDNAFSGVREMVTPRPERSDEEYLGDAVYASFDGYHIWLRTGDSNNQRIALEPGVFNRLIAYQQRLVAQIRKTEAQQP